MLSDNPFLPQLKGIVASVSLNSNKPIIKPSKRKSRKIIPEIDFKPTGAIGIWQTIYGSPISKSNSYRIISLRNKATGKSHGSLAKSKELKQYEKSFILQCTKYRNAGIENIFKMELNVYLANARIDLDGVFKSTLDILQQVKAIKNDNLCYEIIAKKFIDKSNPRIEFKIDLL